MPEVSLEDIFRFHGEAALKIRALEEQVERLEEELRRRPEGQEDAEDPGSDNSERPA